MTSELLRHAVLIIFILCLDLNVALWSSAGVSQSFTFFTTKYNSTASILWQLDKKPYNYTLFLCLKYTDYWQCDPNDNAVADLYSAEVTINSSLLMGIFTIKSISPLQHNTKWYCRTESDQYSFYWTETAWYTLNVFAAAESPRCEEVSLLNENLFSINCQTQKVFPESMCMFYVVTNKTSSYELRQGQVRYSNEKNVTTGYFKTICTYIVSAATLGPGSHMFRVVMYPNITINITDEIRTTSQYTIPITLGS